MMCARPVAVNQFNVLRIGLIQGRVIHNQQPAVQHDVLLRLLPEGRRIRREAVEEAGQGIMGRTAWTIGLDPTSLRTTKDGWGGDQKVDVVEISHFRLVHASTIPHNASTA